MTHLILVARELEQAGFYVYIFTNENKVIVSLSNRRVNSMEVEEILRYRFEGIGFDLQPVGNSISVEVL